MSIDQRKRGWFVIEGVEEAAMAGGDFLVLGTVKLSWLSVPESRRVRKGGEFNYFEIFRRKPGEMYFKKKYCNYSK